MKILLTFTPREEVRTRDDDDDDDDDENENDDVNDVEKRRFGGRRLYRVVSKSMPFLLRLLRLLVVVFLFFGKTTSNVREGDIEANLEAFIRANDDEEDTATTTTTTTTTTNGREFSSGRIREVRNECSRPSSSSSSSSDNRLSDEVFKVCAWNSFYRAKSTCWKQP